MTAMRVVLAADHILVRAGIRALLEQLLEVHVVAEASDGREAVHLVTTTRPNVVLMVAPLPVAPVHETDMVLLPQGLHTDVW